MSDTPPVRLGPNDIEVDQRRGEWPFANFSITEDGKLEITVDDNPAHSIGKAASIQIGKKKWAALIFWLTENHPDLRLEVG